MKNKFIRIVLSAAIVSAVAAGLAGTACASGGGIHLMVSELVRTKKSIPKDMKEVLDGQQDWYKTGSLVPDLFYNSDYLSKNEVGHNGEFFTEFLKITMNERCGRPRGDFKSADCRKNLAFLLGALSHVSEDAVFDEEFVGKGKQGGIWANCSTDLKIAENFTDTDLDICAAKMIVGKKSVLCDEKSEYGGGGNCYTCPSGSKRTILPANGDSACEKFKEPEVVGKECGEYNPKGWGKSFADPNGRCYSCPDSAPHRNPVTAVTDGKACYDKAIVGPFKRSKETRGKIPSGAFKVGKKWYSCGDYKHNVLFNVNDERVCSKLIKGDFKRKVDMCDLKDFSTLGLSGSGYLPFAMQAPQDDLLAAYSKAGTKLTWDPISKELNARWNTFGKEHLAGYGNFMDKITLDCKWGYDNLVKGAGGMNDSASEVAAFLGKVWKGIEEWRDNGNAMIFERSTGRKYTAKQNNGIVGTIGK